MKHLIALIVLSTTLYANACTTSTVIVNGEIMSCLTCGSTTTCTS